MERVSNINLFFPKLTDNTREGRGSKEMLWWIMAAVGCSLWKTRNDLIFSNIVIKSPKQLAYESLGFLKQWIMMARKDGAMKEAWLDKLKEGMERW